jgi:hypothetical protein
MPERRWDPSEFTLGTYHGLPAWRASTPMCDFCLSRDVRWEYPAAPMDVTGHPFITHSHDEWAACDGCKDLLEAHKLGPLVERCIQGHLEAEKPAEWTEPPMSVMRRQMRENLLRFMDARTGPPRPWTPPT